MRNLEALAFIVSEIQALNKTDGQADNWKVVAGVCGTAWGGLRFIAYPRPKLLIPATAATELGRT